jgi:hypothetical protein
MQTRQTHFHSLSHAIERMLQTEEGKKRLEDLKAEREKFIREQKS